MAFDFPASPAIGQNVQGYVWDGQKWIKQASGDAHVAVTPPSAPLAGDLWWNSSTGVLSVWSGSSWAIVSDPGGVLTGGAPFEALGWSGLQINGSMAIDQERGGVSTSVNGATLCDGYSMNYAGTMVMSGGQLGKFAAGFPNSVGMSPGTAQVSLGTNDYVILRHRIEGYRTRRLNWGGASVVPITIAFRTAHTLAGTYSVVVRNGAANRSYIASYTQSVSGAGEFKAVTIPGDMTGTWSVGNTTGIEIFFVAAAGAGIIGSVNAWSASGAFAAPGQVNGASSTSNNFLITGVVVLPGTEAPTIAQLPLAMRPHDQELVTCKRYYQKFTNLAVYTSAGAQSVVYPVEMRATPAITGGGAGFTLGQCNSGLMQVYQTSPAFQTIVCDARL